MIHSRLSFASVSLALVSFAGAAHAGDDAGKPPAELAELAKSMAGTWKCTGKASIAGQQLDVTGTVTHKADFDGWWIASVIDGKAGKIPMHSMFTTTYDPGMKKLYRFSLNGRGGHSTAWGTIADKKITWEGEARWNGKDLKSRSTEEMVSAKELHISGESSADGKTWDKEAEIVCKK